MTLVLAGGAACSDSSKEETSSPPTKPSLPAGVEITRPIKLTEAARVPENDPSLDYVEVLSGRLIFHYKAAPKIALAVGNVVAGAQGRGYLRRLDSVAFTDSRTLEADTSAAYITDLILDGAFSVHTDAVASDWAEGVGSASQALEQKIQVFTPTTKNGFGCGDAYGGDLTLSPQFDIDFDFDIDIDIEAQLFPPKGRLVHALMQASGGVFAGIDASTTGTYNKSCSIDLIKLLRTKLNNPDALKWQLKPIRFMLGSVPVFITHSIEPAASVQAGAQVKAATALHAAATFNLTVGAEFKNGQWLGIWKPTRVGELTTSVPDSDGNFSLTAAFTTGVNYKAFLWDVVGPKVGLEGFVQGEYEGDPQKCSWSSLVEGGVNVVLGLEIQVPLMDWTLADWTTSFNLDKYPLAQSSGTYGSCVDAGPDGGPDAGPDGGTDASVDAAPDGAGGTGGSDGGACADAPAPNGSPCTCAAGCASGHCVDGVCCMSKCDALCYSCSAAKKNSGPDGDCGVTKSGTNPEGECPATTVCWGGLCKPPQGYPCTTTLFVGAEKGGCGGYWSCRDGVCCNNSFCAEGNQSCTACTQAKTGQPDGTCATVFAGTDPFNSCELPGALVCVGPTKPGTCM